MKKINVIFHQDNAPCLQSMKEMVKLNELHFDMLSSSQYTPDLAPQRLLPVRRSQKDAYEKEVGFKRRSGRRNSLKLV